MATWSEIQAHMRETYRLNEDEPDMMAMVWRYDDGRTQRIVVRRYHAAGYEMVEFKSPFALEQEIDPRTLLRDNSRIPFGSVALAGNVYLIVHRALLSHLSLPFYDEILRLVAGLADQLEGRYSKNDQF